MSCYNCSYISGHADDCHVGAAGRQQDLESENSSLKERVESLEERVTELEKLIKAKK